jgi:hypothetical protein
MSFAFNSVNSTVVNPRWAVCGSSSDRRNDLTGTNAGALLYSISLLAYR